MAWRMPRAFAIAWLAGWSAVVFAYVVVMLLYVRGDALWIALAGLGMLALFAFDMASPAMAFDAEVAAELHEQARDLADMAGQFAADEVREEDAKYLAQRAYNAHRGKRAYEAKLSRASRRPPSA